MKLNSAFLAVALSFQMCEAQTTYYRADGGVTVVEQSSKANGNQTTEVRRYENQDQYIEGEYAAELLLAQFALVLISEASPHVSKAWSEFKIGFRGDFEGSFTDGLKVKFAGDKRPLFPLVTAVEEGSVASTIGVKPGDFVIYYNESHLGWATKTNNPLQFKMLRAREEGIRMCDMIVFREGEVYTTKVPAGIEIGVSLTEGPLPWDAKELMKE